MHPLKSICLLAWLLLFAAQLGLLLPAAGVDSYWAILLAAPLLLPLKGLIADARYTYKWLGFLTLIYFCVGISELAANPQLKLYGFVTVGASLALFLGGIYYARYLGFRGQR